MKGSNSVTPLELRQLEEIYSKHWNVSSYASTDGRDAPLVITSVDGRCGQGLRRRKVVCGNPNQPRPDHACDTATRPDHLAPCTIPCPTTTSTTTSTPPPSAAGHPAEINSKVRTNYESNLNLLYFTIEYYKCSTELEFLSSKFKIN